MKELKEAKKKVLGFKQSQRAIERGTAGTVYLAKDAEDRIRHPILELCAQAGIRVKEVETMAELGRAGGIQVATAVAVAIKEI